MGTPPHPARVHPTVQRTLHLAQQAMRNGDLAAAEQLCVIVVAHDPGNAAAAGFLVRRALQAGDAARARSVAHDALQAGATAELHFLHAQALEALGDRSSARDAYARAHAAQPDQFVALLCQGEQEAALGMADQCLHTYQRALDLAARAGALEATQRLPADLQRRLAHASHAMSLARVEAAQRALAPIRARHGRDAIDRIDRAVQGCLQGADIRWPHPLQRPTFLLVPDLPPQPWFERDAFDFLADVERRTAAIRAELVALLADASRLSPYVDIPPGAPSAPVWRELNRSARWSSYHLHRHGERNAEHCARCPRTAEALDAIPIMRVPGHSPEALFSILKGGTRIPPHTGVTNGRLTVHLPLVVPPDCGFLKVAGEARTWREGECLVFDDSFVHEAWNDSAEDRAVLIFDVWDPRLSQSEREAMSAAVVAIGDFNRTYAPDAAGPTHG